MIVVSPNTKPYKAIFDRKRQHGVNNFMVCESPTMSRMHVPLGVTGKGMCTVVQWIPVTDEESQYLSFPLLSLPLWYWTDLLVWQERETCMQASCAVISCNRKVIWSMTAGTHLSMSVVYWSIHSSIFHPSLDSVSSYLLLSPASRKKEGKFNSIHETNQLKLLASYKQHLTLPWNWCSYIELAD